MVAGALPPPEPIGSIGAGGLWSALEEAPVMVAVTVGASHELAWQNRQARAAFGEQPRGMPLAELFPAFPDEARRLFSEVYETGRTVEVPPGITRILDVAGSPRRVRYTLSPLADGHATIGVMLVVVDVTAEAAAAAAARRAVLLANLSEVISGALDATGALRSLTDALVAEIADVAAIFVAPATRDRTVDGDPMPPQVLSLGASLRHVGPPPPPVRRREAPWSAAIADGRALVLRLDDADTTFGTAEPGGRAWLEAAGVHSLAIVPLVLAGDLTAVMVLAAAGPRPPYRDADLAFFTDVAARAGTAIGELRVRAQQRRVAERLQRALLPMPPADLPGLEIAGRYVAGSSEVEVGGDWWEVLDLGHGFVGLGIGDVAGRGLGAAALMGQARVAMHAAGHAQLAPAEVLALLDGQLAETLAREPLEGVDALRFATALYGVVDVRKGRLRVASAGHPPLLLRTAAGRVEIVWPPVGAPLGLLVGGFAEAEVGFKPGDTAVLFTDGLVESRHQGIDEGVARLADLLEAVGDHADVRALADALLAGMEDDADREDDIALLVVRAQA